jgi:hypothetical protein
MARLLHLGLGPITIDFKDPDKRAQAQVIWPNEKNPADDMRVAAASRACLMAFGFDIIHDFGLTGDQIAFDNAAEELSDDEGEQQHWKDKIDDEVAALFKRSDVRAAVAALAGALMLHDGQMDGSEAEAIIDRHLAQD